MIKRIMSSHTSIRDVALYCGVSPATVSRVLNDRAGKVGPETRARVLSAVRRLNYKPGRASSNPPHAETLTLGIVSGIYARELVTPGYFREILNAVLAATDGLGQNATLFAGHLFRSALPQSLRIYCDGRCDGLLVVAPTINSPLVQGIAARGIPFVLIGDRGDDANVSYCDLDYADASRSAVEELLDYGHRRIALFRGFGSIRAAHDRETGYRQALAARGVAVDRRFLSLLKQDAGDMAAADTKSDWEWLRNMMRLPREERPTAIFCYTDGHAAAVQKVLQEFGLHVPNDVSLIGFDDILQDDFIPPLTSVSQPYLEMGRAAVEALLAQIRGDLSVPQQVLLQGTLIRRASVASPREFCRD